MQVILMVLLVDINQTNLESMLLLKIIQMVHKLMQRYSLFIKLTATSNKHLLILLLNNMQLFLLCSKQMILSPLLSSVLMMSNNQVLQMLLLVLLLILQRHSKVLLIFLDSITYMKDHKLFLIALKMSIGMFIHSNCQ